MIDSLIPEEYKKNFQNKIKTSFLKSSLGTKNKKTISNTSVSFHSVLEEQAEENFKDNIENFLEELTLLEKKMIDSPTIETVEAYRKKIGDFLSNVSKNFQPFEFYRARKIKCKIFKVIDKELDQLYKNIIAGQLKGLHLLDKLKYIKGLFIDLKVGGIQ